MNKVLSVNVDDFDCTVEAGVYRKQLNNHLKSTGLWFPIDPGGLYFSSLCVYWENSFNWFKQLKADACIGGMSATSASGTVY